jgi:hypothetical protein
VHRPLRHPVLRLLGALLPLLLLLAQLGDGTGMHRCPAHDGTGVPVTAAASHAGMAHHSAPPEDHQHGGPCSCLGACHGPTLLLGTTDGTPQLVAVLSPVTSGIAPTLEARPSRPHLLPFAIGPPVIA